MSSKASASAQLLNILLLLVLLTVTGCGADVHWFPPYERQPTTPDPFTFTTQTGVALNTVVTSNEITVSGLTADESPITITGPSGSESKYSINGATAVDTQGTVKNGDKVTVSHKSASGAGQSVTSTLTIGGVSGTFTSTTIPFDVTFGTPTTVGTLRQVLGTFKTSATGPHRVSIKDSTSSGSATYSFDGVEFVNVEQQVALGNNATIYVRNLTSNVTSGVTTTLVIDDTEFVVPLKLSGE